MTRILASHPAFLALTAPAALLVFLLSSGFFAAWSGPVVAVVPARPDTQPSAYTVLIDQGKAGVARPWWPAELVQGLALPPSASGEPPARPPEGSPTSTKRRFSLQFSVSKAGEPDRIQATTSPTALGLALMSWVLLVLLRNAWLSGSPLSATPGEHTRPNPLPPANVVERPARKEARPSHGPPPPKGRRKR